TISTTLYDERLRPVQTFTTRTPTPGAPPESLAAVSVVAHQRLVWDPANNLGDVYDDRPGAERPDAHRPQTTHVVHDALYRVSDVYYEYTDADQRVLPFDIASDWRDTEARHRGADPMRAKAAPMVVEAPSTRVVSLAYDHDWLANMT